MGFLDKVKETSKQVGEKAQQLAEAGQDKYDDFKTDKQISALKEQIGDLVYRGHTGDAPTDADAQITALVGEIRAAEAAKAEAAAQQTDATPDACDDRGPAGPAVVVHRRGAEWPAPRRQLPGA